MGNRLVSVDLDFIKILLDVILAKLSVRPVLPPLRVTLVMMIPRPQPVPTRSSLPFLGNIIHPTAGLSSVRGNASLVRTQLQSVPAVSIPMYSTNQPTNVNALKSTTKKDQSAKNAKQTVNHVQTKILAMKFLLDTQF